MGSLKPQGRPQTCVGFSKTGRSMARFFFFFLVHRAAFGPAKYMMIVWERGRICRPGQAGWFMRLLVARLGTGNPGIASNVCREPGRIRHSGIPGVSRCARAVSVLGMLTAPRCGGRKPRVALGRGTGLHWREMSMRGSRSFASRHRFINTCTWHLRYSTKYSDNAWVSPSPRRIVLSHCPGVMSTGWSIEE